MSMMNKRVIRTTIAFTTCKVSGMFGGICCLFGK